MRIEIYALMFDMRIILFVAACSQASILIFLLRPFGPISIRLMSSHRLYHAVNVNGKRYFMVNLAVSFTLVKIVCEPHLN